MSTKTTGILYTVGAYLLWGIFPLYFILLAPTGPFEVVAWRLLLTLVFCILLLALTRGWQRLRNVELPLAAPVMLAGIRTSVIINIGTAAIASTVGANTLGTPIIIGLSGFNTAYIIQGALLVALAAIVVDRAFERLAKRLSRHRHGQ